MPDRIYTIGHSNHLIETFITLLQKWRITALADVRSHPFSRYAPQYSQGALRKTLLNAGIAYVFLGKELGARSENPNCYHGAKVSYELLAKEPQYSEGLIRLRKGMNNHRIVMMCSEKDPLNCHRAILVARSLHENEISVEHILADGMLETHAELEHRMLNTLNLIEPDLFQTEEEILNQAYERHSDTIAYRDDSMHKTVGIGV